MNEKRVDEWYSEFNNAVARLTDALAEDLDKGDIVIDGTIQRFEFTFELGWKLLKAVLAHNGIQASTPRAAIKEAFQAKMIDDGQEWIEMLEDRNKTAHIYDAKQAHEIYAKIKEHHYVLLEKLANTIMMFVSEDEG